MRQWLSWQWSSDLVALLAASWLMYFLCWWRVRRSGSQAASIGRLAFWTIGLSIVAIAVLSAIDELAGSSLPFHMVQHVLLIYVAPPLGLLAQPVSVVRDALAIKRPGKEATSPLHNSPPGGVVFILKPAVAWSISTVVLCVWHLPVIYDYALAHEPVHEYGEHLTLLLSFLIWWHPLIGSIPQLPYLSSPWRRFLYLLAGMIPMTTLGVLILFWPDVIYTYYLGSNGADVASVLYNQRIGGFVMLASSMAVLFVMGLPLQYYDSRPLAWP
jgi:cytochrome c oxidase assembly factor CtaG